MGWKNLPIRFLFFLFSATGTCGFLFEIEEKGML